MSQKIANNYNKANIAETLSQLKLTQKGSNIFTHYADRLIANTSVSDVLVTKEQTGIIKY